MKLLFDANISFRAVNRLINTFPNSNQVRDFSLEKATDRQIWEFAKENNYTIVTFDSDFYDLTLLLGFPPKVIWLRSGNTTTENVINILTENQILIHEFIKNKDYINIGCLELNKDILEV